MITTFHQKRIRGVLGVLPENEYDYDEETKPFNGYSHKLRTGLWVWKAQSSEIKDNDIGFMCVWI